MKLVAVLISVVTLGIVTYDLVEIAVSGFITDGMSNQVIELLLAALCTTTIMLRWGEWLIEKAERVRERKAG